MFIYFLVLLKALQTSQYNIETNTLLFIINLPYFNHLITRVTLALLPFLLQHSTQKFVLVNIYFELLLSLNLDLFAIN